MKNLIAPLAASCLLVASQALAANITFNDFSSVAGLQLNGNAAQAGNALRVTPALAFQSGSAFSTTAIALNSNYSFSTFFSFQITASGGISDGDGSGADGLAFVVQTVSNTSGGAGGGIGYLGISNSMAVEFDTYNNGPGAGDPDGNHVAIDLGGVFPSVASASVGPRLNNGGIWYSWVDYDGVNNLLEVRLSQVNSRPVSSFLSLASFDLGAQIGSPLAYVGFTSGTGAAWGNHDILSWEFRDQFDPISSVPEPASLLLLGTGVAVLAGRRLRRR